MQRRDCTLVLAPMWLFDQKYSRWISQFGEDADQHIDENGEITTWWISIFPLILTMARK